MSITTEYQKQMVEQHTAPWGRTAVRYGAGYDVLTMLDRKAYMINTVLDFGCGEGVLGEYIQDARRGRVVWTDYDPGMKGIDRMPQGPFDLVVTCDVLEHVEPHLLDATIRECFELSDRLVYHNIPCYPTGTNFISGPYRGQNIHLTVEDTEFWKKRIQHPEFNIMSVVTNERLSKGAFRKRVTITSERIRERAKT